MKARKPFSVLIAWLAALALAACAGPAVPQRAGAPTDSVPASEPSQAAASALRVGAERLDLYLPLLQGRRVGLLVNQSARVGQAHLVDTLLALGVNLVRVFAPEHGFRGDKDPGALFDNETDPRTGLPIVALYGDNKKPRPDQLADLDLLVFDIQDVGVRFFTFISSMHLAMQACAQSGKPFVVLDRPNPLGDYVDGPLRQPGFESFVGMHPIPVVHGLTVGELARMIVGEGWLGQGLDCALEVVPCQGYTHATRYPLPVKPSPNLPNDLAVRLYPSLCFFEATQVSVGRGTEFPFQAIGYPKEGLGPFSFIPRDMPGMQMDPIQEGQTCHGLDLRQQGLDHRFSLAYFIEFHRALGPGMVSRREWFNLLAGTDKLLPLVEAGKSEEEIRASWQDELREYKQTRKKYLLYPDFE